MNLLANRVRLHDVCVSPRWKFPQANVGHIRVPSMIFTDGVANGGYGSWDLPNLRIPISWVTQFEAQRSCRLGKSYRTNRL